jgi:hypothetical protein
MSNVSLRIGHTSAMHRDCLLPSLASVMLESFGCEALGEVGVFWTAKKLLNASSATSLRAQLDSKFWDRRCGRRDAAFCGTRTFKGSVGK